MPVILNYGATGRWTCDVPHGQIVARHSAPAPCPNLSEAIRGALGAPRDFPPLEQLCVPGDRVLLALDRHTPSAEELIAGVWEVLQRRGVAAEEIMILQPAALDAAPVGDPRGLLPKAAREQIRWGIHDPTDPRCQAYLATTARNERIYLAREVTDADVVIGLGPIAYDSVLGIRGTGSVLYPGLSNTEAIARARGEGHRELGPDDERPLRQSIDEIAWLLGMQFVVQVIPGAGRVAAKVLAGAPDSVLRAGRMELDSLWRLTLPERTEVVVLAVEADSAGHGWFQLGEALATARNLVAQGGKIVVLTQLDAEPGDTVELIRQQRSPREALAPIRKQGGLDMIPAAQLASAADWAQVYLLSHLASDLVEELFMTPLESEVEVSRLLGGTAGCVLVEGAQHVYGEIAASESISD
ncbi:MAG: lactate racemase domain-containing protein [Planctomycetales bacterium]